MNESGLESKTRTRTVTWEDPQLIAAGLRGMSGLEAMRVMQRGEVPAPPVLELLGLRLVEVEEGRCVFELLPGEHLYNSALTVFGGAAVSLLDAAMTHAVHSTLPAGVGYTTAELKVNFIRPITAETGPLRGEGKVIHVGRRLATAEGRVTDQGGRLYAHGVTTC
ncbi:MAG: PaaI family thioesterase, partial [Proteobacteria bacterium]|nr:PaaI family thioesterase [Pseudomonadota bacterium]